MLYSTAALNTPHQKHSSAHRPIFPINQNISYLHIYAALWQFLHKTDQFSITNKIRPVIDFYAFCHSILQFSRQRQKKSDVYEDGFVLLSFGIFFSTTNTIYLFIHFPFLRSLKYVYKM